MPNKVEASESTFRNVPISDSGAKIPQNLKQADRSQKFKFFECLQALMQGRLPTNEQIDHFLALAQNSSSLESRAHMLSADGQSLYKDFQELIRTTRGIVFEKNEQELFQNFIYHCTKATDSTVEAVQAPNLDVGITPNKAKEEGKQTLDSMVSVAKLVTTNSEFRSILNELFQLAREVFTDGADSIAQNAQAFGDQISKATDEFSQSVASASQAGGNKVQQGIYRATEAVQNKAGDARDDPELMAQGYQQNWDQNKQEMMLQKDQAVTNAKHQAMDMRQRMEQQRKDFGEQAQLRANEARANATRYANEKMPVERRQNLIERLKLVLGQIQADPQYQGAIDSIMNLFGTWRQRSQGPAGNITTEATKVIHDPNVEAAIIEFKVILQRWAQGYGLDPMIVLVQNMWQRTRTDPELSQYVDNLSVFLTKALREPNYVTSQNINQDASMLIDHGRALLTNKYKADTDALMQEGQIFIEKLNNDPKSREVAANFQKFSKDLFYDKKGKLAFKPHLFDDFRYVVLPSMMEAFQFVPIPRIEYSDLKVDLMFDNMILTSTDLLPRLFEVHMNNTLRMVPRGNSNRSKDANTHDFNMLIEGVEANVRDVDYYVKTKEGFRFQDRGVADVLIHKKGMDIRVSGKKTAVDSEVPSLITIDDVKVKIHSLSIKMRNSKHPIMYAFAQPFIKTVVKNAIAHSLEAQIKELLVSGDKAVATSIRDTRIRTGKNTFGALLDTATSFMTNKVKKDEKQKKEMERKKNSGNYNRTSRVIFDQDGLCVLDPVKHMELKVGQPLKQGPKDVNGMNGNTLPWTSTAFDINENDFNMRGQEHLPGVRRTQGTLAM